MSLLTTASKNDKTALKLINKYADSCNNVLLENKALKAEIKDLRDNIKINKEIIEGFFTNTKKNEQANLIIDKYKEENKRLYFQNEQLNKEIESLHSKLSFKDQTYTELITQVKQENDSLKTQMFVLQQLTMKNKSLLSLQKKRIEYKLKMTIVLLIRKFIK